MHRIRRPNRRPPRPRGRLVIALTVAATVLASLTPAAHAGVSPVPTPTDGVDGTVFAIVQVGDRTIIGGDFTSAGGRSRQNLAAIRADGTVDPSFAPRVNGTVYALAASADGARVFVGGEFSAVDSVPRANVAAVDATTGAVASTWVADTDSSVRALARAGNRLYVGGTFRSISGLTIRRLAAVDTATAAVDSRFTPWPDWTVRGLAVSPDGSLVYAVGGFARIAGVDRPGAAEIDAFTGRSTAFSPTAGGVAIAVGITPNGSRIFYSTTNNRMYAYDPAVSNVPVWTVQTSGDTQAIAASDTEVYFGGHFSRLTTFKVRRLHIASVRVADGTPTDWRPRVDGFLGVWALAVTSDALVVGGDFETVDRTPQPGFARFVGQP